MTKDDLYSRIAERFNVSRGYVKSMAFIIMYDKSKTIVDVEEHVCSLLRFLGYKERGS